LNDVHHAGQFVVRRFIGRPGAETTQGVLRRRRPSSWRSSFQYAPVNSSARVFFPLLPQVLGQGFQRHLLPQRFPRQILSPVLKGQDGLDFFSGLDRKGSRPNSRPSFLLKWSVINPPKAANSPSWHRPRTASARCLLV
jgi:hypothetical protein